MQDLKIGDVVYVGPKRGVIIAIYPPIPQLPENSEEYKVDFFNPDPANTICIFPRNGIKSEAEYMKTLGAQCECGVKKYGAGLHSSWCPAKLYE